MSAHYALLAAMLSVWLGGCSSAQALRWGVERYCDKPKVARAAIRRAVAVAVAPNGVRVRCRDDAPSLFPLSLGFDAERY